MAMIEKMSIRGVRSFGVDDSDTQTIIFERPLTLVVGSNGAGKTVNVNTKSYLKLTTWIICVRLSQ